MMPVPGPATKRGMLRHTWAVTPEAASVAMLMLRSGPGTAHCTLPSIRFQETLTLHKSMKIRDDWLVPLSSDDKLARPPICTANPPEVYGTRMCCEVASARMY